jgi:phosphohistidine phosphatase SixA
MRRSSLLLAFLLCTAIAFAQNAKTVFLVRHAEKASEAKDALLSETGEQRAACLAGVLADAAVKNIFTSDVKRTQQTAQPLADRLHLPIKAIPAADIAQFASQIKAAQGNTLVVGHSDTLPQIIQQLTRNTVTIGSNEYDGLFIVSFDPNPASTVVLHYCMANPAAPAQKMQR